MPPQLTHIALHVADLEASIAFYTQYCGLHLAHDRVDAVSGHHVVWLAEQGQDDRFVLVLIPGGTRPRQTATDFSHLGIAMESRAAVDAIAAKASREGRLAWPVQEHPYPVGYYCGVYDPDGAVVEFSYGQPLGVGADRL